MSIMIKIKSVCIISLLSVMASGCGGGGGSSESAGPKFTLSTSELFFGAPDGGSQPSEQTITGTVTDYSGPLYIYVEYTNNGLYDVMPPVLSGNSGTSTIVAKNPTLLGQGVYFDTITVSACSDAYCANQISGSPSTIPVTYVIGIATTPSTLSFSSAAGAAPQSQSVTVYDYVKGANWSSSYLYVDGDGWLRYTPQDGQSPSTVTVNVEAMPVGTASGSVFNSEIRFGANAGHDQVTLPISYTIN